MKNNLKFLPANGLLLALFVMVLDQFTKYWALSSLFSPPQVIKVLFCFNLVPVWNTGISFGMLAGYSDIMPSIISGLTIIISIGLVGWLCVAKSLTLKVALGLILGGAIGNIIDRIQYGAVIDFIDIHFFGFHWPAFNLADASITIGVGFFLVDSFFTKGVKQN
jgi:signal peptidase II